MTFREDRAVSFSYADDTKKILEKEIVNGESFPVSEKCVLGAILHYVEVCRNRSKVILVVVRAC